LLLAHASWLAANLRNANSPAARRKGLKGCEAATARSAGAAAIAESRKARFLGRPPGRPKNAPTLNIPHKRFHLVLMRALDLFLLFLYNECMILPLDYLIGYNKNIYELTCAVIRRSYQITMTEDEEIEENFGKVVSTAIAQVLTKKVTFRLEE
jgi:DNA-directed RNA polymerase subunit omega